MPDFRTSHLQGGGKKRARPFLELGGTFDSPTRKKSCGYVCSQTQPRGLRPQKVFNAIKVVTRFPRSRLSKMHLHCDSRPRRCIASTTRIAFARSLPKRSHLSLSRKTKPAWQRERARHRARDIELIKNCNYRAEIRRRALFRWWCKGHVNVIDRKSVIAERPKCNALGSRERKANACTQLGHGKRALLLYPANRSVVLIARIGWRRSIN